MPEKLKNDLFKVLVMYLCENDSSNMVLTRLFKDTSLPIGERYNNLSVFFKAWWKASDEDKCFIVNYFLYQEVSLKKDINTELIDSISALLTDPTTTNGYLIGYVKRSSKEEYADRCGIQNNTYAGDIKMKYLQKDDVIYNDFDNPPKLKLPIDWKRRFELFAIISSFIYTSVNFLEWLYHCIWN